MSNKMKKKLHSPEFKFKVAIEAIRGDNTTAELCQKYGVVSSQIFKWKKDLLDGGKQVLPVTQHHLLTIPNFRSCMPKLVG
ncbi:MAG: transposase [Alphaproteobacteria bacterium]